MRRFKELEARGMFKRAMIKYLQLVNHKNERKEKREFFFYEGKEGMFKRAKSN